MNTVFENGLTILEQKQKAFNQNCAELLLQRDALWQEIEEQTANKHEFQAKLHEHTELIEGYAQEKETLKQEMENLLIADNFSVDGAFEEKRLQLVEINKSIDNTNYFKEEIIKRIDSLEKQLVKMQFDLKVINNEIPENPYEIMKQLVSGSESKEAYMEELQKVFKMLSQNLRIDVDFELNDSKKYFEISAFHIATKTATIGFEARKLVVDIVKIREDVEHWHGEIQDTKDVMIPVLNIKSKEELMKMLSPYEKNHLHIQTTSDINGLRYIKDIFIKNDYATNEKEAYIRIGTRDVTAYERDADDVYTKGIVIEFSEYPFIF